MQVQLLTLSWKAKLNFAATQILDLRRYGSVGSVTWQHLRSWAEELMHQFGSDQFMKGVERHAFGSSNSPGGGPGFGGIEQMDTENCSSTQGTSNTQSTAINIRPIALVQQDIDYAFGNDMVLHPQFIVENFPVAAINIYVKFNCTAVFQCFSSVSVLFQCINLYQLSGGYSLFMSFSNVILSRRYRLTLYTLSPTVGQ